MSPKQNTYLGMGEGAWTGRTYGKCEQGSTGTLTDPNKGRAWGEEVDAAEAGTHQALCVTHHEINP